MKKRIICSLLCIIMLLSALPVISHAETIIDRVSVSVDIPYAGKLPSYEATISTGAEQTTHYDNNYAYMGICWIDVTDSYDLIFMRPGIDTFKEGRKYRVSIILKSSDGYSFANASGKCTVHGKINLKNVQTENEDDFGHAANVIVLRQTFEVCKNAVETVNLTVDEVGYNKRIDFTPSTSDVGYKIEGTNWYEDSNKVTNPAAQFRSGKTYKLVVRITAKDGYEFVNSEDEWKSPMINAAINGDFANTCIEFAGDEDPHKTVDITYEFGKVNNYTITHVSVRNLVVPTDAQKPVFTASADGTGYTASKVVWRNANGTAMNANDFFEGGKVYSVEVTLAPKSEYVLSMTHGTINGKAATVSGTTLKYTFAPCPATIKLVEAQIEQPAVGIKCPYSALLIGRGFSVSSGNNSNYESGGVQWYDLSKDFIYMYTGKSFESGKTYRVRIGIKADDGFSFAPDMKATINGKPARVEHLYPDLINIYMEFTPFMQDTSKSFPDVKNNDWFKQYVDFAVSHGIFKGQSDGKFAPNKNITRGEFVQVLVNISGVDTSSYKSHKNFNDVNSNDWFAGAVNWAYENGIASGDGKGGFNPNGNITREQMCILLVKYAQFKGFALEVKETKTNFADDAKISSWAKDYVYKCQMADLVNGTDTNAFNPQGNTLRCQAATVFTLFYKDYIL